MLAEFLNTKTIQLTIMGISIHPGFDACQPLTQSSNIEQRAARMAKTPYTIIIMHLSGEKSNTGIKLRDARIISRKARCQTEFHTAVIITYWFTELLKPADGSCTKGLSCAPRCVMFPYDRLHRSGELLHANDEARGTKEDAKAVDRAHESQKRPNIS